MCVCVCVRAHSVYAHMLVGIIELRLLCMLYKHSASPAWSHTEEPMGVEEVWGVSDLGKGQLISDKTTPKFGQLRAGYVTSNLNYSNSLCVVGDKCVELC